MAVDPELVRTDLYLPSVDDHDRRVVRDGWTYYVQAVRRPRRLGRPLPSMSGGLLASLVALLLEAFLTWRARRRPWTVGVVRLGNIATWNGQRMRVVHRETIPDAEPGAAVDRLCDDVAMGRFAP